jgi:hypothetical protein
MRTRLCLTSIFLTVLAVTAPQPVRAWGFEAHRFIMGRAIGLLPPEIRPFFEKHAASMVEHTIDPDLWRTAGWEAESPRHFLDMDAYGEPPFAALPRDYDAAVKKYGLEFVTKNGLVPWRTAEMHAKLTEAFAQKTPYARDNIKFFSAVMTHYVADAHVPFHAALNHDGQLTGQWGIHSRFESELFERYRTKLRVAPGPLVPIVSARDFIFETLIESFPLTLPILAADKAAVAGRETYDDEYFAIMFAKVQPVLEKRLSDAITGSASLIVSAWIDAGRPALPIEEPRRSPRPVRRK